MKAIKAVKINYEPDERVKELLKNFRQMVNYCIDASLEKGITSRYGLAREVYYDLKAFELHSCYSVYAIGTALSKIIIRNGRRERSLEPENSSPRLKSVASELRRTT